MLKITSSTGSSQQRILFSSNGFTLQGTLHLPAIDQPPLVVGSHGLYADSNSPKQIALAKACNALGIAYFRFDHRGCGKSEGEFNEVTSLQTRQNDLLKAVEIIAAKKNINNNKLALFGSSMGGAVCLSTAIKINVSGLITFAAPIRSRTILSDPHLQANRSYKISLPLKPDLLEFDISSCLTLIKNILIFHGDADEVVPFSDAQEIYQKAGGLKKMIIQKNGDHQMSLKYHQDEFVEKAGQWFKKLFN